MLMSLRYNAHYILHTIIIQNNWRNSTQEFDLLFGYVLENEIDGNTLLKLTETMIATLLPKMKQQVQFLELQKTLQAAVPAPQAPVAEAQDTTDADHNTSVEANGYVSLNIHITLRHSGSTVAR